MPSESPTPSRLSRAEISKPSTAKKSRKKRNATPPYDPDEVDAHYERDWDHLQTLDAAEQRQAKKEMDQRHLGRKRTLEAEEDQSEYDATFEQALYHHPRMPLPSTPRPMAARRELHRSAVQQQNDQIGQTVAPETPAKATIPPNSVAVMEILNGLSRQHRERQAAQLQAAQTQAAQTQPRMQFEESGANDDQENAQMDDDDQYYESDYDPEYD
jgi:hypothetical protein